MTTVSLQWAEWAHKELQKLREQVNGLLNHCYNLNRNKVDLSDYYELKDVLGLLVKVDESALKDIIKTEILSTFGDKPKRYSWFAQDKPWVIRPLYWNSVDELIEEGKIVKRRDWVRKSK